MDKRDFKIDMFVAVMQNKSSLSKNRLKVKRVGKIVGIYDGFVDLILFDYELLGESVILGRKLYKESFRFSEVFKIDEVVDEGK